jgi:fluoride exporter
VAEAGSAQIGGKSAFQERNSGRAAAGNEFCHRSPAKPPRVAESRKPSPMFSEETIALSRFLLVLIGGATGSLVRYVAGTAIMTRFGGRFPLGTLVINVTGSFLIGFLMTILTERFSLDPAWRLLLVVGFLGGYTTFSSFEWETFSAVREGGLWTGMLNVIASVLLGYAAVWLGWLLARR